MTSAIPAVPSGLREDLYHSAPMVLVRYSGQSVLASPAIRGSLAVKALGLASACAALAFFYFATRERKIAPAVVVARAPIAAPRETTAVSAPPRRLTLPERPNRRVTEFILAESSDFQSLGPVKLRLTGVDAQHGSYNLSARIGRRQFTRTNVKLDQAVKLADGRRTAPEIVVGAIVQNRVWGYLSEPKAKGRTSRRHRTHRR